jgi:hypothetical protein
MDRRLSYEEWIIIARSLSRRDLSRLARVSRYLRDLLLPLLCRTINVPGGLCGLMLTARRLQQLLDYPYQLRLIREFTFQPSDLPISDGWDVDYRITENAINAIQRMDNLRSLRVKDSSYPLFSQRSDQEKLADLLNERRTPVEFLELAGNTLYQDEGFLVDRVVGLSIDGLHKLGKILRTVLAKLVT